jgi:hypothetical protein
MLQKSQFSSLIFRGPRDKNPLPTIDSCLAQKQKVVVFDLPSLICSFVLTIYVFLPWLMVLGRHTPIPCDGTRCTNNLDFKHSFNCPAIAWHPTVDFVR